YGSARRGLGMRQTVLPRGRKLDLARPVRLGREAAKRLAPPAFRRRDIVERVDVEAGDPVLGVCDLRRQALDQGVRPVAASKQQAREETAVPAGRPFRFAYLVPRLPS